MIPTMQKAILLVAAAIACTAFAISEALRSFDFGGSEPFALFSASMFLLISIVILILATLNLYDNWGK